MGSLLLDHVERVFSGGLENVEDVLEHIEGWIVCEGAWIAETEEGIEGLAVFRHGNDNETILDLLIVACLGRLRDIEEGLKEWGCEGEEEFKDAKINVVRGT